MTAATTEQTIREQNMFGVTVEQMRQYIEQSLTFRVSGPNGVMMSMLSDAQEEMAMGETEDARQTINRVKWMITEYVDWKAGA